MAQSKNSHTQPAANRTPELVLGIIGGVLGLIVGVFTVLLGGLQASFGGGGEVTQFYAWATLLFATIGVIAVFFVASRTKLAGLLLIISGVGGLLLLQTIYVVPGVLLIVAGIMCLARGRQLTH